MNKLIAWWKTSKWAVFAVLGVVALIVGFVFRSLFTGRTGGTGPGIPPPPSAIQQAVEAAHEEALKARIQAKAEADEHTAKVAEISKIDDGAERRKRLAEYLKTL
jgi:hypothetical protein